MGYNIPLFRQMGRGWGRGDPPPRGSYEWVGVADMWEPGPDPIPPRSKSGFQAFEIGFTELDAADRWMERLHDNIKYARQVHGDKVLSKSDVDEWDALMARWVPFRHEHLKDHAERLMLKENKLQLDALLNESKAMHDRFARKGMAMVPVPYMGELVLLLRGMPKSLNAAQMHAKLEAGIECGNRLLDENTAWWQWRKRDDTRGLVAAISAAKTASEIFARSRKASDAYQPGNPAYDESLRRLTKIWIEAAGLYGIVETKKTAEAEAWDEARHAGKKAESNLLWLLLLAGAGYLGLQWIFHDRHPTIVVAVPDAHPPEIYY
jgi:hypothetical protein